MRRRTPAGGTVRRDTPSGGTVLPLAAVLLLAPAVPYAPAVGAGDLVAQERGAEELEVYGHADFDWRIRPLEGESTRLEAFRGQVLFLNLWASWCTPCVREMASIERLRDRLADTDVTFLIIATEGERPVRGFLRRYRYDLPIYLEEEPIPNAFGLRGLPTSWIVDAEGKIVLLRHGEAVWDTDEVEAFLRTLASGPIPSR